MPMKKESWTAQRFKASVEANTRIQKQSLNPHHKLNLDTKASVRITPLGGLGEIGGNITVIETPDSAIVIDVGMSFPNEDMHGVDILVPDFSYLFAIKDKIAGVIITHAHEISYRCCALSLQTLTISYLWHTFTLRYDWKQI